MKLSYYDLSRCHMAKVKYGADSMVV
ncbi:hypothetical protein V530_02672, partial [Staphylococcus aureus F45749]